MFIKCGRGVDILFKFKGFVLNKAYFVPDLYRKVEEGHESLMVSVDFVARK